MRSLLMVSGVVLLCAVFYLLMVPGSHPPLPDTNNHMAPGLGPLHPHATPLTDSEWATFASAIENFSQDLFHSLATKHENLFFSPSSLAMSLGVVYLGADGQTQTALSKALHVDHMAREKIATGFSQMLENIYSEPEDVQL